ncbi:pyruvate kinase [Candidatus Palauibacter sp.]|uniref:pyruvate kinase n=1 Tax=Candidatus Palauibacter sp. TaxID=3101350 RepID=UPI003AF2E79A
MSAGFRRAKIVSTIGPATWDRKVLYQLIEAGTDAVRINFTHTSSERVTQIVQLVAEVARQLGRPVAIIGDLRGPKIRVGDLPGDRLDIEPEESYWFFPEREDPPEASPPGRRIPTTYPELAEEVEPGTRILLDDGHFEFIVEEISDEDPRWVSALAFSAGVLKPQKGINLPGVRVGAPALTEKDLADIEFSGEQVLDYLALSFVRRPADLETTRQKMDRGCLLIAKIEKSQALENLTEILPLSDAVMVARGDLGVELPYEEVPMIQKRIIRLAQERARPVITATQMLESMIESPHPTRAEVSDVANALLDGTDAVMLSAETAAGGYPVEAVRTMDRIIRRIEHERLGRTGRVGKQVEGVSQIQQTTSGAIAAASLIAVERVGSPFIVTFTQSGYTARIVSAQRPSVPILAITDQWRTYNQLALVWGVKPVIFHGGISYTSMLDKAREVALELGMGEPGQRFVVTAGVPFHVPGTTNMMRVEEL